MLKVSTLQSFSMTFFSFCVIILHIFEHINSLLDMAVIIGLKAYKLSDRP